MKSMAATAISVSTKRVSSMHRISSRHGKVGGEVLCLIPYETVFSERNNHSSNRCTFQCLFLAHALRGLGGVKRGEMGESVLEILSVPK